MFYLFTVRVSLVAGQIKTALLKAWFTICNFIDMILPFIIGALVMLAIYGIMFLTLIGFGYPY